MLATDVAFCLLLLVVLVSCMLLVNGRLLLKVLFIVVVGVGCRGCLLCFAVIRCLVLFVVGCL